MHRLTADLHYIVTLGVRCRHEWFFCFVFLYTVEPHLERELGG